MANKKHASLIALLVFAFAIFGLWFADLFVHWSERFIWFDMVLHFLGGLWMGAFLLWLLGRSGFARGYTIRHISLLAITFVIIIGALWEVYQYSVYVMFPGSEYGGFVDSISDMIFDTLGAVVAVVGYIYLMGKPNGEEQQ